MSRFLLFYYSSSLATWLWIRPGSLDWHVFFVLILPLIYVSFIYAKGRRPAQLAYETASPRRNLWLLLCFLALTLLISCAELLFKIGDAVKELGMLSLVDIRVQQLSGEGFRSLWGRITGLAFVPFIALSGAMYLRTRKFSFLLIMLLVSAFYSVLMTGKGHLVMGMIVATGALIEARRTRAILIVGILTLLLLSFIQDQREGTGFLSSFAVFLDYFVQPWEGLWLLLNEKIVALRTLPEYRPSALEFNSFTWRGASANVYTGFGIIIYQFGLFLAPIYLIFIMYSFRLISYFSRNCILTWSYIRLLIFLYFSYFLFIDLILFYNSFLFAIVFGFVLLMYGRGSRKRSWSGLPRHKKGHRVEYFPGAVAPSSMAALKIRHPYISQK